MWIHMRFSETDDATVTQQTAHYVPPTAEEDSLLTRLVFALSEVKGVPPGEYDPGLHSLVDPDALEHLFGPAAPGSGELVLAVDGMEVRISSDGSILIVE